MIPTPNSASGPGVDPLQLLRVPAGEYREGTAVEGSGIMAIRGRGKWDGWAGL